MPVIEVSHAPGRSGRKKTKPVVKHVTVVNAHLIIFIKDEKGALLASFLVQALDTSRIKVKMKKAEKYFEEIWEKLDATIPVSYTTIKEYFLPQAGS
jgi:hypothetical protein